MEGPKKPADERPNYYTGNLFNRLLQQLPKPDLIKTADCWAKLVFPLLVSTASKVIIKS